MNKIEKLINELCPNGVLFKKLYQVCYFDKRFAGAEKEKQMNVLSFKHISAKELKNLEVENGNIKLLATGKFDGYTTIDLAKDLVNEDEILTLPTGGNANIKYYNGKFIDSGNIIFKSSDICLYSTKYIYYCLLNMIDKIEDLYRGGSIKHPSMSEIIELEIPVPPLEIQQEIVNIVVLL